MIWRTKYGIIIRLCTPSILHMVDTFTSSVNHHNLQIGHSAKLPSVLQVGINSSGQNNEPDQFTLQPVLLCRKSKKHLNRKEESDIKSDKDKDDKVHA